VDFFFTVDVVEGFSVDFFFVATSLFADAGVFLNVGWKLQTPKLSTAELYNNVYFELCGNIRLELKNKSTIRERSGGSRNTGHNPMKQKLAQILQT